MAFYFPPTDLENTQPLIRAQPEPEPKTQTQTQTQTQKPLKGVVVVTVSCILIISLLGIIFSTQPAHQPAPLSSENHQTPPPGKLVPAAVSRGKKEGVSEKVYSSDGVSYPWTNAMLTWQRSGYHFQPQQNWMNDPNGIAQNVD